MNPLILFYTGSHPDSRGRFLFDVLQQDDDWLETCHDYIQWLFPNREPSRVTPDAPIITKEVQNAFLDDELLRNQLRASFKRILSFYGLKQAGSEIVKAENWSDRKSYWFTHDTHNNLRITRILKCLSTLGLSSEACMFYKTLNKLQQEEPDCGPGTRAYKFWHEAIAENSSSKANP
ncbi:MAG: hypothetical protein DHS20C01_20160 [marine bacterium B5-7]|nr:MAG: hypothetical protein DHS20C01_20160 [marine bacterium B5-7]